MLWLACRRGGQRAARPRLPIRQPGRRSRIVTAPTQAPGQLPVHRRIAEELGVREGQVAAAVELLDGGATVPFIARYRKEGTGTLDDAQLRTLEERLRYLRELDERRGAILESIRSQGKLDEALEAQIMAADSKARLEDIYLPYKPKRRTKAQIAREAGLEPLAHQILAEPRHDPQVLAGAYVNAEKGVPDEAAALDGARSILVERFGEDADLIGALRERMWSRGRLVSRMREGKQEAGAKFADYFEFAEPFTRLPSHRILAMFRGEREEILDLDLDPEDAPVGERSDYESRIAGHFGVADPGRPADPWLPRGRKGGRGGRHRQAGRDGDDLPARAEAARRRRTRAIRIRGYRPGLGGIDRHPRPARRGPPRRADRHRP